MAKQLRRVLSGLATTALVAVALTAPTQSAYAASGTATCATSNIVGIWVDVDGGRDGFASRWATSDPRVNTFSYDMQGKKWKVHVGCGGTSKKWKQTIKSERWSTIQGRATISCADTGRPKVCIVG